MDFEYQQVSGCWAGDGPVELVERKGIGHPDSICDAIAERASALYSRQFFESTGRLPHHYFDKVLLAGGGVDMGFGHGAIVSPYRLIVGGKAILNVGDLTMDVESIFRTAASDVLLGVLVNFDPCRDLVIVNEVRDHQGPARSRPRYRPENIDVLPSPSTRARVSNDTNLCTAFAPLTMLERAVLTAEHFLATLDPQTRDTGTDIKVVGVRRGVQLRVVVNVPFIASRVPDMETYRGRSREIAAALKHHLDRALDVPIEVHFNPQDVSGLPYLTVTGSVADTGDLGVVGRGNRANGLITPMRPMSIEAMSGKSPIDNTGKLYGLLAQQIADAVASETGVRNEVFIVTFRDRPLEDPYLVSIRTPDGRTANDEQAALHIVQCQLKSVYTLTERFVFDGVVSW